jgi:hypothetical protein
LSSSTQGGKAGSPVAIVNVFASTLFRSAGVHEADAELSVASDEHALRDATSNRAGSANAQFLIFFCMKVLLISANSRINYLVSTKRTYPRLPIALCNLPGLHPEHPTAVEGCRSVSRG